MIWLHSHHNDFEQRITPVAVGHLNHHQEQTVTAVA